MLKENWVAGEAMSATTSIISYILQMRDKLESCRRKVKVHMQEAQHKQKVWYDKAGQKVWLLLWTGPGKLLAKWQGPYTVTRKAGPVTSEIFCPDKSKQKQVLHVNLLKEYRERNGQEIVGEHVVRDIRDVQPDDDDVVETDMVPLREKCNPQTPPEHLMIYQCVKWVILNNVSLHCSQKDLARLM